MNKLIITPILVFLFSGFLIAQSNLKNTVILYNIVPLRVDLNPDGTIQTIYGQDNKFLKGYTVIKHVKDAQSEGAYGNSLAGYKVLTTEDFDIQFRPKTALLTQEIINLLDKASDNIFFKNTKMVISSYLVESNNASQTLYKNRLNALLSYLEIKNISKDKIIINADEIENATESFKITFVN
jgi:hypothetical protein